MELRKVSNRLWKQTHDCDLTALREMLSKSEFDEDGALHIGNLIDSVEDAMVELNGVTISLHNLFVTTKEHLLKK